MADHMPAATDPGPGWYRVWLPRAAAATLVAVVVAYGSVWLFTSTSGFLVTVILSLFIAFALLPAVENLSDRGMRRGLATALVMLGAAIAGFVFVGALLGVAVNQVIRLVDNLPGYVEQATEWLNASFGLELAADRLMDDLAIEQTAVEDFALSAASRVVGLASTALGIVFQVLTIALFVFYILADLPRLRTAVLRRFAPQIQVQADTVIGITISKVGGYVYSRGLLAAISAVFHFVAFQLIGVPFALALALWVGIISQFVPTVGTYIAGVFPLLIALAENPTDALWVLGAILVYQQFENYALAPRVTAHTMDLHPAVAFGSAIIGASLLGGVGALLALPVAATIVALVQTYADYYEVVGSSAPIGTTDEYEQRMRRAVEEREQRRASRLSAMREWIGLDDPSP